MLPVDKHITLDWLIDMLAHQKWGDRQPLAAQDTLLVNVKLPFPLPLLVRCLPDPGGAAVTYTIRWGIGGVPDQLLARPPGSFIISAESLEVVADRGNVLPGVVTTLAATAAITTAAPTLAPT